MTHGDDNGKHLSALTMEENGPRWNVSHSTRSGLTEDAIRTIIEKFAIKYRGSSRPRNLAEQR